MDASLINNIPKIQFHAEQFAKRFDRKVKYAVLRLQNDVRYILTQDKAFTVMELLSHATTVPAIRTEQYTNHNAGKALSMTAISYYELCVMVISDATGIYAWDVKAVLEELGFDAVDHVDLDPEAPYQAPDVELYDDMGYIIDPVMFTEHYTNKIASGPTEPEDFECLPDEAYEEQIARFEADNAFDDDTPF